LSHQRRLLLTLLDYSLNRISTRHTAHTNVCSASSQHTRPAGARGAPETRPHPPRSNCHGLTEPSSPQPYKSLLRSFQSRTRPCGRACRLARGRDDAGLGRRKLAQARQQPVAPPSVECPVPNLHAALLSAPSRARWRQGMGGSGQGREGPAPRRAWHLQAHLMRLLKHERGARRRGDGGRVPGAGCRGG